MWLSDGQSEWTHCSIGATGLNSAGRDRSRAHDVRRDIHVPRCDAILRRCITCTRKCAWSCPARSLWCSSRLQLLFLSGLTLIIGPQKTFYFFARKQKLRGTVCFIGGILLVFLKWPFVGVIIETFGFLNLFGYVCATVPLTIDVLTCLQRLLPCNPDVPSPATCDR